MPPHCRQRRVAVQHVGGESLLEDRDEFWPPGTTDAHCLADEGAVQSVVNDLRAAEPGAQNRKSIWGERLLKEGVEIRFAQGSGCLFHG